MAENTTPGKDRLKEITDGIEQGIREMFSSEKYMRYLRTMSRFHRYSVNNTMLIYMQRPDATLVAGFNKWRDQFGRNVKKGEKSIKIIAPTPFKKRIEQEKRDPQTNQPIRNPDGTVATEEVEIKIPLYKVVSVFDVSQTDGKPLPMLSDNLTGDVQQYDVFMEALRRSAPVPIAFEKIAPGMDGYFSEGDQRIAIREGMSEVQTVCATIHEIAHSKLHNKNLPEVKEQWKLVMVSDGGTKKDYIGGYNTLAEAEAAGEASGWNYVDENRFEWRLEIEEDTSAAEIVKKSRNTEEVEAESVSYAVCAYYGIQTDENSFGYIAVWSKDKELSELRASLETINKTSSGLISDIDRHFQEICKERGIDLTAQQASEAAAEDTTPEKLSLLDEYPMPNPDLTMEDLEKCGYMDGDMLPISKEQAHELFNRDLTVYTVLDGDAGMCFDAADITAAPPAAVFAISREEWEDSAGFRETVLDRMNYQPEREIAFLDHKDDCFAIYQLKEDAALRDLRFEPLSWLESKGRAVERDNYDLVYTAPFAKQGGLQERLDDVWYRFNNEHPADYQSPSLSVSDIVAVKQNGVVSCHYCDSFGFAELPHFLGPENPLKNAEVLLEDDYGMIDGVINNGPKQPSAIEPEGQDRGSQSTSKERPSVVGQLKSQPAQRDHIKTAPKKSAEREL